MFKTFFGHPISPSLSPNSSWSDVLIALRYFLFPSRWFSLQKGKYIQKFENTVKKYFEFPYALSFDSGRSALLASLQALGIQKGDEVIVQAFTCIVVPNAVIWCGAKPVYADIDPKTFNIDEKQLVSLINKNTKAIIVQHTFGKAGPIEKIFEIAKKYNLKIIEDCAHALGSSYKGKKLGTFGDVAIFSLGRDKVISSVHGGFAITSKKEVGEKLQTIQNALGFPRKRRIFQHLMHPLLFESILPLYNFFHIGKIILWIFQKLQLVSKVFEKGEKQSRKPYNHPAKFPNALSELACFQFQKLSFFNKHRKKVAEKYFEALVSDKNYTLPKKDRDEDHIFFRFSILHEKARELFEFGKKQGVIFGDFYTVPMAPKDISVDKIFFDPLRYKNALAVSKRVVNVPTHPRMDEKAIAKVIHVLKEFSKHYPPVCSTKDRL